MAGGNGAFWRTIVILSLAAFMCLPSISMQTEAAYTTTPIVVQGDAGFVPAGFTGSGTYDDPYLLKGMSVNAEFKYHGILISNTTMHFRIEDCSVNDAYTPDTTELNAFASGSGIMLYNVSNGEVTGFTGDYDYRGISVVGGRNVTISDSLFSDCIDAGVVIYASNDCVIRNSSFQRAEVGDHGILIENSRSLKIEGNLINAGATGIRLTAKSGECSGNLIDGNDLRGQRGIAIQIGGPSPTSGNVVSNNLVRNALLVGIDIVLGSNETVIGNDIAGCGTGVRIGYGSDENTVQDNDVLNGTYGIYVSPSMSNLVIGNYLRGMVGGASAAIYIGEGSVLDLTVSENTIEGCSEGIRAIGTQAHPVAGLGLLNNTVLGAIRYGAYLQYSENSTISGNVINNGSGDGVRLVNSHDIQVLDGQITGNLGRGVLFQGTYQSLVTGNVLLNNAQEGIVIVSGSENAIHSNAFLFNKASGRSYHPDRAQAACAEGGNSWNLDTGNLWTDWLAPDVDDDGIVDLPYNLTGGYQDLFPLTSIPGLEIPADIAPPQVIAYSPQGRDAEQGSSISVTFSEDMNTSSVVVKVNNITEGGAWNDRTFALSMPLEFETDYQVMVMGEDLSGNALEQFGWAFRTEDRNAEITGRVIDENAQPISGVLLWVGEQETLTNVDGRFSLLLSPGIHIINISAEGYLDQQYLITVEEGGDEDLGNITLDRAPADGGGLDDLLLYIGLVVVIILAVAAFLIWRRRK